MRKLARRLIDNAEQLDDDRTAFAAIIFGSLIITAAVVLAVGVLVMAAQAWPVLTVPLLVSGAVVGLVKLARAALR